MSLFFLSCCASLACWAGTTTSHLFHRPRNVMCCERLPLNHFGTSHHGLSICFKYILPTFAPTENKVASLSFPISDKGCTSKIQTISLSIDGACYLVFPALRFCFRIPAAAFLLIFKV